MHEPSQGHCGGGAVVLTHSLLDPQFVGLRAGVFEYQCISIQQVEITGVVFTGHDSVRCLLLFFQLATVPGSRMSNSVPVVALRD